MNLNFQKTSQMSCHYCHFPRTVSLVVSDWFTGWTPDSYWSIVLAPKFFQIAKRLFEGRGEMSKLLHNPSICNVNSQKPVKIKLRTFLKVLKCDFRGNLHVYNFSNMLSPSWWEKWQMQFLTGEASYKVKPVEVVT